MPVNEMVWGGYMEKKQLFSAIKLSGFVKACISVLYDFTFSNLGVA